jgi:uncharacterized membrane protein YgcG
MRRFAAITGCLLLIASPCFAFQITSYNTDMNVRRDSSVVVTETIRVDFSGDSYRHGIFRDIPLVGSDAWGNKYRIRLSDLAVLDGGSPAQTQTTRQGGNLHIRIGSPDIYVTGEHTYTLRYILLRAVHFFKDHDEVYWNVVGDKWEVPVGYATANVTIPAVAPQGTLRAVSYTGSYGATGSDALANVTNGQIATFKMQRPLNVGEQMTVVVGWPKGIVSPPSLGQEALWFVADNGFVFLPFLFGMFLFFLWRSAGRDPDTGRSETVMYDPPDGLRPAEIGTLIDEKVDIRDIAASIVDLAVRGYITIKAEPQPGFLVSKTDYELTLQKPIAEVTEDRSLNYYEHKLIDAIFEGDQTKWMSSLKYNFYSDLPGLRDSLYDALVKRGYFAQRPDSVRATYLGLGIAGIVAGVASAIFLGASGPVFIPVGWGIAVALCGGMLALASGAMPKKTGKGKDALLGARGFEEYLSRAEGGQIKMQEREGYFEKYLPYAMAFGIADRWARAFDGIQTAPPNWYQGTSGNFLPSVFAYDMMSASHNWGSTMTAQPRSSGSGGGSSFFGGGSGFSGGFSGGGGGGGGGGSW